MLLPGRREGQRWLSDAVPAASRSQRCGRRPATRQHQRAMGAALLGGQFGGGVAAWLGVSEASVPYGPELRIQGTREGKPRWKSTCWMCWRLVRRRRGRGWGGWGGCWGG